MNPPPVTAVIVHYRTPEETVRAVRAVNATAPWADVVVVDNASGDGIADRLERGHLHARVFEESVNRGYGAACNRGAQEGSGRLLLFLNSDTEVRPGAVAALVAALDEDLRAVAVGPRLSNLDGSLQPSIQRNPTPWRIFCESSGLATLAGGRGLLRGHWKTREDHARPQAVETLQGAALLLRRTAFEEVGGFDEKYFLYAEETDLLTRLSNAGYRILFEPGADVVHLGGASTGGLRFYELRAGLRRYVEKFHGRAAARFTFAVLTAGGLARYALALATPGPAARERRRRYRAALRGPGPLIERADATRRGRATRS
jgi:N-acetylglucosaminyl-diphospho-decaprenol L-rhamnosyltransferase